MRKRGLKKGREQNCNNVIAFIKDREGAVTRNYHAIQTIDLICSFPHSKSRQDQIC